MLASEFISGQKPQTDYRKECLINDQKCKALKFIYTYLKIN